ncbi:hypothetical protein EFV92_07880 [Yersinia enterocolitica]|nr:hypothetical protein [Yersinia enterocolitica]EKN5065969.1 hypothetical protein [Yersinia enterocolitica]EKN5131636.1 hypothetical protein [Yersinia enterocolitica]
MKKMKAKSVCLFWHQEKVLLAEAYDMVKDDISSGLLAAVSSSAKPQRPQQSQRFRKKSVPRSQI